MCKALAPYLTSNLYFSTYPPNLQPALENLCRHPDAIHILDKVVDLHGKIAIVHGQDYERAATWDWNTKVIALNTQLANSSLANRVTYVLFELCNAAQTEEFIQIINHVQDPEELVRNIEKLEHQSALKTRSIALSIFGEHAEFDLKHIHTDFNLYYALEQISGHSEEIAKRFISNPRDYQGNLYYPLSELHQAARNYLYALLYYNLHKNDLAFTHFLDILRAGASADDSERKAVDCALLLFPDYFFKGPTAPAELERPNDAAGPTIGIARSELL
ncbi:hypothetical protein [Estrella lausannensis]|uniref:Uncharacterized protein n=1 Tax=Estrella lausannensis TaxID=483423 RepID=A0A0H5DN44_9BACT|nr:hypothetical protein [Estrella lausannensis]CRX37661.1 hypothetical protein ELAC_0300 [Estrella lausannensis]